MGFPQELDPTAPIGSGSPALGDDQIRALKELLADVFGLPVSPSQITAALATVDTAGALTQLRFAENAAPGTPAANQVFLFARDVGGATQMAFRNSAGAETSVGFVPRSYLAGLALANNAIDAVNDVDIAVGMAEAENARGSLMPLDATLVKRIDATWIVGTNQGGLDTGAVTNNTWYHVHLIQRSDTGVVDALFSLSATAPSMPASYDRRRRIGAVRRGTGALLTFVQLGDYVALKDPPLSVNATNPGTGAVLYTLMVPGGVAVRAVVNVFIQLAVGANWYLSDPQVNDEAPAGFGASDGPLCTLVVPGATAQGAQKVEVFTDTSSRIRSRLSASDGNTVIKVATLGWWDRRGRDS